MNMGHTEYAIDLYNLKIMVRDFFFLYQSRDEFETLCMLNHLFPFNRSAKYGIGLFW